MGHHHHVDAAEAAERFHEARIDVAYSTVDYRSGLPSGHYLLEILETQGVETLHVDRFVGAKHHGLSRRISLVDGQKAVHILPCKNTENEGGRKIGLINTPNVSFRNPFRQRVSGLRSRCARR